MSRRIPLSRAAQLIGIKRRELQKQIQAGDIPSFDGTIEVSDLLRVYPDVQMHDNTQLERMEQIMENAVAKQGQDERSLPEAHVLATRVNGLAQELVDAKTRNLWYEKLLQDLNNTLSSQPDWKGAEIQSWLHSRSNSASELASPARQLLAQELSLRTMASNVKISGSTHEFTVEGTDTVLESGIAAGLTLEFGCNDGTCGLCRARTVEGEVTCSRQHEYVLSEAEKSQGYFLMCSYTPVTDVILEAKVAIGPQDIARQRITTKVKKVSKLSEDVTLLTLRMPRTRRMRFLAGQYATIIYGDGVVVDLPIASCPCDELQLEFHLAHAGDDGARRLLDSGLKFGDEITVEGPKGNFVLDEASRRAQIFIACDTGFAPLKSLVENAMQLDYGQDIYFYWIINQLDSHYMENLCRAWEDAFEGFHPNCMINEEKDISSENYSVQSEALVKSILFQHKDIENFDIYIAGEPKFASVAKGLFTNVGMPITQLNVDMP